MKGRQTEIFIHRGEGDRTQSRDAFEDSGLEGWNDVVSNQRMSGAS